MSGSSAARAPEGQRLRKPCCKAAARASSVPARSAALNSFGASGAYLPAQAVGVAA
jgi:hypothetical protein